MVISIFESPPVAEIVGAPPVAAFATVNSLTALPVAVSLNNSLPPVSKTLVPIFGLVKVLFVRVSAPVNDTKLSLCNAALNSARDPVRVFVPRSIDLFVKVSVVALPTSVSVATGSVTVTSPPGSPGESVNSWVSAVAPSNTKFPVIVPPNAIVSPAASPRVIVPPLKVDVPVTVKFPPTPTFPAKVAAPAVVKARASTLELPDPSTKLDVPYLIYNPLSPEAPDCLTNAQLSTKVVLLTSFNCTIDPQVPTLLDTMSTLESSALMEIVSSLLPAARSQPVPRSVDCTLNKLSTLSPVPMPTLLSLAST